jgi:hypothetical protein
MGSREKAIQRILGLVLSTAMVLVTISLFLILTHRYTFELETLIIFIYTMCGSHLVGVCVQCWYMFKRRVSEKKDPVGKAAVDLVKSLLVSKQLLLLILICFIISATVHFHYEILLNDKEYCVGNTKAGDNNSEIYCSRYKDAFAGMKLNPTGMTAAQIHANIQLVMVSVFLVAYLGHAFLAIYEAAAQFDVMFMNDLKVSKGSKASCSKAASITPALASNHAIDFSRN